MLVEFEPARERERDRHYRGQMPQPIRYQVMMARKSMLRQEGEKHLEIFSE